MPQPSSSHLVLVPSYNPGPKVYETVTQALRYWAPVWVVIDGSQDGTEEGLWEMARENPALTVIKLDQNGGKGSAILAGLVRARSQGYSHVLCMDSDGQHPAHLIPAFMQRSQSNLKAMILGAPEFDGDAPRIRVYWRRLSNLLVHLETMGTSIQDSLFGFRIYPTEPLYQVMIARDTMRGFDFDPEAAVRLCWLGVPIMNVPAPVRYFRSGEGGVSHFQYGRDNALLARMHMRLILELIQRLPKVLCPRKTIKNEGD